MTGVAHAAPVPRALRTIRAAQAGGASAPVPDRSQQDHVVVLEVLSRATFDAASAVPLPHEDLDVLGDAAGVASLLIVSASRLHAVRAVPSNFMGFASTFAFLSLVDGADTTDNLTSFGWDNAGIAVAVSLVIGTGLGIAHGELARLLSAPPQEKKTRKPRLRLDGSSHQSEPTDATTLSQEA
jgi:hypothetical protein